MSEKKEYLSEERYQRTSNGLLLVGVGIIVLGIIIASIIFVPKIISGNKTNVEQLQQQLTQLKPSLEKRYADLKEKGVRESWDYKDKEGYEMHLIDIALNPTYDKCEHSSTYSDNDTTREYCKIKSQIYDANNSFANGRIMFSLVPAIMVLMICLSFGAMLIMYSKRRNIMAYNVQQVMPVAQEGIEKMAPTIGKAGASIAKEMAPVYGEAAKEIARGIKEGLNEADKKEDPVDEDEEEK